MRYSLLRCVISVTKVCDSCEEDVWYRYDMAEVSIIRKVRGNWWNLLQRCEEPAIPTCEGACNAGVC
jgi:hypothetical protein